MHIYKFKPCHSSTWKLSVAPHVGLHSPELSTYLSSSCVSSFISFPLPFYYTRAILAFFCVFKEASSSLPQSLCAYYSLCMEDPSPPSTHITFGFQLKTYFFLKRSYLTSPLHLLSWAYIKSFVILN